MSDTVYVHILDSGAKTILKSPEVQALLEQAATQARNHIEAKPQALQGYKIRVTAKGTRARAYLSATTKYAKNHNAKHNTLAKALGQAYT